jgi:26S proteasome regulatory subunit N2
MINYLAEHHNAHLRYGAAMAVGIACAGSGSQDALKILVPLTQDKVDFVKQGALIALAFVFVQVTEVQEPKVATIKKLYERVTGNVREGALSRMGAVISMGILNAGGRNTTISMETRDGNLR